MNFLDHTGHIFSLQSYESFPSGYEYDEQPYIFWINDNRKLSIKNYYIKPIRFVLNSDFPINELLTLKVNINSNYFKLLGSYHLNNFINQSKNIFDYLSISSENKFWDGSNYETICKEQKEGYIKFNLLKDELTEDDVVCITNLTENGNTYSLITFYVVAYCESENVLLSNILISLESPYIKDYCPITIGAEFIDECEPLIINGKNMGIDLPKSICQAIYDTSFYNYYPDEVMFKNKLKELLLNYMDIKGECGNYSSVLKSLEWFGWGDKIKISKLIQTDNEFINQYVLDKFNINNDNLHTFKNFINTTFLSLSIIGTTDSDKLNLQNVILNNSDDDIYWGNEEEITNIYNTFWGEGHPKIKNLLNASTYKTYNEGDINFYKPYYKFLFDELGLKLSALEFYYKKYFLPLYVFIHSSTISHKCYMNDNKILIGENKTFITENTVLNHDINSNIKVKFPKENYLMFYTQKHIIDDNFNEFNKYILGSSNRTTFKSFIDLEYNINHNFNPNNNLYWIEENCLSIPITFSQDKSKNSESNELEYYKCKVILEKIENVVFDYKYIFNKSVLTNTEYQDYILNLGSNKSGYNLIKYSDIESLSCIVGNKFSNTDIIISHQKFVLNKKTLTFELTNEWDDYRTIDEFKKYILENYKNKIYFNNELPHFNLVIKSKKQLSRIIINKIDFINKISFELVDDNHILVYDTTFDFIQDPNNNTSFYKNFVIIPKIINKKYNINFWLNSEFNLYLNVNGKWFTYNFICKIPELQLSLGKLQYKYYFDTTNSFNSQYGDISLFNQIQYLDSDVVKFNSFMWQPDFVNVNNIDFYDNLLQYYKDYKYNLTVDENSELNINFTEKRLPIDNDEYFYIIQINNQQIFIHIEVIEKYLIQQGNKFIPLNLDCFNSTNKHWLQYIFYSNDTETIEYKYIYNEDNELTSDTEYKEYYGSSGAMNTLENVESFLFTLEDGETFTFIGEAEVLDSHILNPNSKNNFDNNPYNDNYLLIFEEEYNNLKTKTIQIKFELHSDNTIHFYIENTFGEKFYLQVIKTIYKNQRDLIAKYKEIYNIVNKSIYLNTIHQYYIYKNGNLFKYNPNNLTGNALLKYEAEIYNKFFYKDDEYSYPSKINIPGAENIYDFYLMHDNDYWYCLYISKLTKNKYQNNQLSIYNENKELELEDYVGKIRPLDILMNETIQRDYSNINKEILDKIKRQTGLQNNDLLIVYNTTETIFKNDPTIIVDGEKTIEGTFHFSKYLINKIYNKNIGKTFNNNFDDDSDILWNDDIEDTNNYIGVNWINIPIENVVCPKCGHNEYFTFVYPSSKNDPNEISAKCTYQYENGDYCNYEIKVNNSSILYWNDKGIPFKMIYNIVDDVYDADTNPSGKLHLQQEYSHDKYSFNMNGLNYYLAFDETSSSYYMINKDLSGKTAYFEINSYANKYEVYAFKTNCFVSKEIKQVYNEETQTITYECAGIPTVYKTTQDDIFTYNCDYIPDIIYNTLTYTYFGNITNINTDNIEETHYIEIIEGLEQNISYFTEISDIYLYSKENNNTKNDKETFYILYDGSEVYDDIWNLTINVSNTSEYINDIIKIYTLNNVELQWVVNPEYNFNAFNPYTISGAYCYKIKSESNKDNEYYVKTTTDEVVKNKNIESIFIKFKTLNIERDFYINFPIIYLENNVDLDFNQMFNGYFYYYDNVENYFKIDDFDTFIKNKKNKSVNLFLLINNAYYNIGTFETLNKDINDSLYLINTEDFIEITNNVPKTNIYLDDVGNFFILKHYKENNTVYSEKVFVDRIEINQYKSKNIGSLFSINQNVFFSENYQYKSECVILNNEKWINENKIRLNISDIELTNEFDNLWYFISDKEYIANPLKENWEMLIYISEEIISDNKEWFYTINNIEYKYDGILFDNYIKENTTLSGVYIKLVNPIQVQLNKINGTDSETLYYDKIDTYKLIYQKSNDKFLINRMDVIPVEGKKHFSQNDIIVSTIDSKMNKNNIQNKVEFKMDYGSKWIFKPASLKMNNFAEVNSNSELAIISIGNSNIKYEKGYYDINVNYSLDGNIQNSTKLKTRILVN